MPAPVDEALCADVLSGRAADDLIVVADDVEIFLHRKYVRQ
jgi:hypothetical protein